MENSVANRTDSEYLSTLERGLRVMQSFSAQRSEMTITQVAVETELNPAVVRRCLNTLEQLGYIAKRDNLFSLTAEVLTFGTHYVESAHLETAVRPHLQRVRDVMGDSSSMALLSRGEVLYLVHVSTDRRLQIDASVGTRFPAYCTSMGKVLLTGLSLAEIDRYCQRVGFIQITGNTITDSSALKDVLRQVSERGYATALDELDYGIVSVALPITDEVGRVIAAINCSTSTSRVSLDDMVATRLPVLREAAAAISLEIRSSRALARAMTISSIPE
jgi:IclR family pca regulon transcriptional regulator